MCAGCGNVPTAACLSVEQGAGGLEVAKAVWLTVSLTGLPLVSHAVNAVSCSFRHSLMKRSWSWILCLYLEILKTQFISHVELFCSLCLYSHSPACMTSFTGIVGRSTSNCCLFYICIYMKELTERIASPEFYIICIVYYLTERVIHVGVCMYFIYAHSHCIVCIFVRTN